MREKVLDIIISEVPQVRVRVIDDVNDSDALKKSKKKFPFKLDNSVDFTVITNIRTFTFNIYKGYNWNGADIPRFVWFVGSSKDNDFLVPSMVHDYLLEFKNYIFKNILHYCMSISDYRRLTSLIFRHLLKTNGTNTIKANIMAGVVDVFQATLNRGQWDIK